MMTRFASELTLPDINLETIHPSQLNRAEQLLFEMIDCIMDDAEDISIAVGDNGEEILLDFQRDGARYVLVRFPMQTAQVEVVLSPREKEIARLVAKGLPNKAIAAVLDISSWTVATHLRRIFAKMGVRSRAEMVANMMRKEIVLVEVEAQ